MDSARILVVEDDPVTQRILLEILNNTGYTVETATDGVQAIERFHTVTPDLLILDVVMPRMNGLEVCRIVKASVDTFIPIILVTAQGDVEAKVAGLKLGADDYLIKPFHPLELQARVASMLRIKSLQDKILQKRRELEALSITDPLTGLLNHRAMQTRLREEFVRARRYNEPLSVIMIDVDYFKNINDALGHLYGDKILGTLSQILTRSIREIDSAARYGGDEFMLILPQTHFSGALAVADRIWRAVNAEKLPAKITTSALGVSVGIAFYPNKSITCSEDLVELADQALYQAKSEGRNRICIHQHLNYLYQPNLADS